MNLYQQLLVLCPLIFFAGFVDAIAGGGGIITLPAYYIVGLPPHMAMGTNKFSSTFGTTVASVKFLRTKNVHLKAAMVSVPCALAGSACGARLALLLSAEVLRYILVVALPLLAVFLLRGELLKNDKRRDLPLSGLLLRTGVIAFLLGGYDGFFGPGTGTFLILAFNYAGLELLTAAGNAKIVNWASNLAALCTFLASGNIVFALGLPAAVCSLAGSYLGASLAVRSGTKIIRPVFILVFILLLIKILYDMIGW